MLKSQRGTKWELAGEGLWFLFCAEESLFVCSFYLKISVFLLFQICFKISVLMAPFASLKKQTETLFRLIYYERKPLFHLKKQAEKYRL